MPTTPIDRPSKPDMVAQLAVPASESYPLHHTVKNRLHPEYVAFYNKYLLSAQPVYDLSIDEARVSGGAPPSHSEPLPVGKIQDIAIFRRETPGPNVPIRCFTPPGTPPRAGWPLVHYYHGGGWVFGNIDTENTVCSHICVRARAVVITTDYRLAAPRIPSKRQSALSLKTHPWRRLSPRNPSCLTHVPRQACSRGSLPRGPPRRLGSLSLVGVAWPVSAEPGLEQSCHHRLVGRS
jgi:hypothetical protein